MKLERNFVFFSVRNLEWPYGPEPPNFRRGHHINCVYQWHVAPPSMQVMPTLWWICHYGPLKFGTWWANRAMTVWWRISHSLVLLLVQLSYLIVSIVAQFEVTPVFLLIECFSVVISELLRIRVMTKEPLGPLLDHSLQVSL